jgi:hypothetical protein
MNETQATTPSTLLTQSRCKLHSKSNSQESAENERSFSAYALLPEETLAICEKTSTLSTPAPFLPGLPTTGHAS